MIQYDKGKPVHPKNGHDDIVISMALAYYVIKDLPFYGGDTSIGNMYLEEWKKVKKSKMSNRSLPWNVRGGNGKGGYK